MNIQETKSERELRWERDLKREQNALTIMPLPLRFPTEWYDLLPKVLHLLSRSPEESKFFIPEEKAQAFLQMWQERLMRRDGDHVWVHLGGVECFQTIPNFARGIENRIRGRDGEIKATGGLKALLEHWRTSIDELQHLDDKAVLETRIQIVRSLEPLMSTLAFSGAWSAAFARAKDNLVNIRPVVQKWAAEHGKQWNLDQPFGGKLDDSENPMNY